MRAEVGPRPRFAAWIRALRLPFCTVSLFPVVLGGTFAWAETPWFSAGRFLLTLAGTLLVHCGANLLNDWFDDANGSDRRNRDFAPGYSGGSRVLQEGLLRRRPVLVAAISCFAAGAACALPLLAPAGWPLVALGVSGILFAVLYSYCRNSFFIGELLVGGVFGTGIMQGAFLVQTGRFSLSLIAFSLPVSLLVSLVLLVNEIPDSTADRASGKRTLVVRLGSRRTVTVVACGLVLVFASLAWLALSWDLAMLWAAFLGVPPAAFALRRLLLFHDRPSRLRFVHPALIFVHAAVCTALFVTLLEAADAPAALPLGLLAGALLLAFVPPLWRSRSGREAA